MALWHSASLSQHRKQCGLTLLSLGLVFLPLKVHADDELFALSLTELLDLKVSVASFFEESELDVASSVSVVTRDNWQTRNARRVGDALESIPSVVAYPTWGGAEAIAMRGYATELSVRGLANTLDGVPLNSYTYATSAYDKPVINLALLDRMEVIRGPGSTLYGSDAFHGVLSYQTRESERDEHSFRAEAGAPSYGNFSFFASQGLGDLRIHTGIAVQKQGRQGLDYDYTSPYSGQQESGQREHAFRDLSAYVTADWGGLDSDSGLWRVNLYTSSYEAKDFPGIGTQFFAPLTTPFDIENANIPLDRDLSGQESDFVLGQVDFEKKLANSAELALQAYHWESDQTWKFDNSRYPNTITTRSAITLPCLTAPSGTNPNPLYCAHELQQGATEQRSGIEAHLKSRHEQLNTKWVMGGGLDRLKVEDSLFRRVATDGSVYIDESNPYEGDKRYIRFAFAQFSSEIIDERLQLIYGLRYDDYSDIGSHSSPRLGAIATISEDYTSKLLYGHAFRAPTVIERLGNFDAILANPDISPEEIDTLEWVNIFHDKNSRTEVTAFLSKWKDGIVLVPTGVGADNQYRNTRKNQSWGLEFSTEQKLGQWTLNGSASYVRSKNKGDDLEYSAFPAWLASAQVRYAIPQHNLEIGAFQRIMMNYRQSDNLGSQYSPKAKDYYRTDLNISHKRQSADGDEYLWSIGLLNVFGRENILPSLYNAESGIPDYERRLVASLEWRY